MLTAQGSQLPSAVLVFDNETGTNHEWLDYLAHRPWRQTEPGSDDVDSAVPLGQDAEVLLFDWPKAQGVDSFQEASPAQVSQRDRSFAFRPADPSCRLQ